jgi:HEAT repeat protein
LPDEALNALRTADTRDEKLRLVHAAALSASEQDTEEGVVQEFRNVMRDPDAGVRQSVVIAMGYFPHPGLVELVRELRDRDPVEHVRRNAAILLDGLAERELTCTASSPKQLRPDSYRTVRPNCRRALIRCSGGSPVA